MFSFTECYISVAWATLVFWQWASYTAATGTRVYSTNRPRWMPPTWVFPVAWTLLYTALTIMMYFFTRDTAADSWQLALGFALFVFHIACNKEWSVAFWSKGKEGPSQAFFILMVLMLPTSLALYFPFIINNQTELYYVPVIMVSVYNAWLLYAAVLNYYWMANGSAK